MIDFEIALTMHCLLLLMMFVAIATHTGMLTSDKCIDHNTTTAIPHVKQIPRQFNTVLGNQVNEGHWKLPLHYTLIHHAKVIDFISWGVSLLPYLPHPWVHPGEQGLSSLNSDELPTRLLSHSRAPRKLSPQYDVITVCEVAKQPLWRKSWAQTILVIRFPSNLKT